MQVKDRYILLLCFIVSLLYIQISRTYYVEIKVNSNDSEIDYTGDLTLGSTLSVNLSRPIKNLVGKFNDLVIILIYIIPFSLKYKNSISGNRKVERYE